MKTSKKNNRAENGAALVTVLMISVLLGVACVAMLSAVGANSRNSTDVLSETKAYYAAESGLQATINVLRGNTDTTPANPNDNIDYMKASTPATSNYASDPNTTVARLSAWITYNYPTTGTANRVVVGQAASAYSPNSGAAYGIVVTDPDNTSASLTFNTTGKFLAYVGGTLSSDAETIYIPNKTASPRTVIHFGDALTTTSTFTSNPRLGSFDVTKVGGGVAINKIDFQINYNLTAPRAATLTIQGSIDPATAANPVVVKFLSQEYKLLGSKIELCSTTTSPSTTEDRCPTVILNLTTASPAATLRADITPLQPYRLLVKSTGYGPNGARKELQAILQKSFFNGFASAAGTTMLGTNTTPPGGLPFLFSPGNSSGISYSGGNCASTVGCVPSFGLTNPQNLAYVTANPPSGNPAQMQPPPALLGTSSVPDWQQSPQALDALVRQLRATAQNSQRYFLNSSGATNFNVGSSQNPPGSWTNGTGITFCEGSCNIAEDGGGILVVTGKLTNNGNFSFKGLIIVTGEEGWERNGAGTGQVVGNVVIAPYNKRNYVPENLSSTFLAPRYSVTGGGGSDVIYDDISATLDNTSSVSDFILGVAEK